MNQEEYLNDRLEGQINWYDDRSRTNQVWHKESRMVEIIGSALIPFLAGLGELLPYHLVIIGLVGVSIAISVGASSVWKFQENWIQYRTTAETLKHEKFLFQTGCSPYDGDNAFNRFVARVEGIISKEHSNWTKYTSQN